MFISQPILFKYSAISFGKYSGGACGNGIFKFGKDILNGGGLGKELVDIN